MPQLIWKGSPPRNGIRKYGITILGIIVALTLIAALAGLYFMKAAATGPSAAESRTKGWVTQLDDEQLTPARQLAQQHLEQAGDASVDPLIAALNSPDSTLRRNAAEMLGFIASPRALDSLTALMANDPAPSVRSRAAWALGELHDLRAVGALELASVADQDAKVRREASGSIDALRAYLAEVAGKNKRNASAFAFAANQPEVIYLSEMNQVSVSRDGGQTWSDVGGSLPSRVTALAVSPSNTKLVFAGTESLGLYVSTDGGTTWSPRDQGLGLNPGVRLTVTAITIDPYAPERVYVASGEWIGATHARLSPRAVSLSLNSGDTWQQVNIVAARAPVTRLVLFGRTLYELAGNQVNSFPL